MMLGPIQCRPASKDDRNLVECVANLIESLKQLLDEPEKCDLARVVLR